MDLDVQIRAMMLGVRVRTIGSQLLPVISSNTGTMDDGQSCIRYGEKAKPKLFSIGDRYSKFQA